MTIAITGATGQLGRLVIESLKGKVPAAEIRALARSETKAADLGVSVRVADYSDPATLARALEGVSKLLLISSSEVGQRAAQHRNVIDAAKAAGVSHIAYTSILRADDSPISLAIEHRDTEATLRGSGIPHTFLRDGWYLENYIGSVAGALAHGAVIGAARDGKISAAARADYAEAAAVVLTSPGHEGKTYELAGDTAFTMADLAAEISRQTGRTIPYQDLGEAGYAAALVGVGLPEPLAQVLAQADTGVAAGWLFDEGHALSKLIGRPTARIAETVATVLAIPAPANA